MSNERMEFYDNEDNERQVLTLEQFLEKFSLELKLNYVDSNYFVQNMSIILNQIQSNEFMLKEVTAIAFSEQNKKIYLVTYIKYDGFIVQEIGYDIFPINSIIQKYDVFGNLESYN
jgi:hypothetical protein